MTTSPYRQPCRSAQRSIDDQRAVNTTLAENGDFMPNHGGTAYTAYAAAETLKNQYGENWAKVMIAELRKSWSGLLPVVSYTATTAEWAAIADELRKQRNRLKSTKKAGSK